jgi:CheY-like chemotaxis protein
MQLIRDGGGLFGGSPEDGMTNYSPTILYIDDESDQRIFLGALLEYRGFRVRTVRRGLDALELMVTERFDAVIVDYDLPDMTGTQLAQEIRAFEPSARVILFSGRAHLTAGELKYVDVHIVNGSLLDNIIETIRGLLELPAGPDLISTLQLDRQRGATKNKLKQANEVSDLRGE